jgi:hypothetical protein
MEAMIRFVDAYRDDHGVEPICRVLEIAPSTYYAHVRRRSQPETAPRRVQRHVELMQEIRRVLGHQEAVMEHLPELALRARTHKV